MATAKPSKGEAKKMGGMFAVHPKKDCPHVQPLLASVEVMNIDMSIQCATCQNVGENWLCLKCSEVFCSRYVNSHMVEHNTQEPSHMITLSFSDLSFWCYDCDSYIESPQLEPIYEAASTAKYDLVTSSLKKIKKLTPAATPALRKCHKDLKSFQLKSSLPKDVLLSRMRAVIYGNCIGDAIGLLTEFMTKEEAKRMYGTAKMNKVFGLVTSKEAIECPQLEYNMKYNDYHRSRWEVGDWTDDSDQMILILRTLLNKNGKADILDFVKRFKIWTETGFKELGDYGGMGIGHTTYQVISQEDFFTDPHKCAQKVWDDSGKRAAPNGGVMRTSVLGIQDFSHIPTVIENTRQICKVTHADPRCIASCVAVTTAIALMLQGKHCMINEDCVEYNVKEICEEAYYYACKELETSKETCKKTFYKTSEEKSQKINEETSEKTSKQSSKEASEVSEETSKHTCEKMSKDKSEETSKDEETSKGEETSEETSEEICQEISNETFDTSKEASKKKSEEASQKTSEDTFEQSCENTSKKKICIDSQTDIFIYTCQARTSPRPNLCMETPREKREKTSEKAHEETSKKASNTSEDTSKNTLKETAKKTAEEGSEETSEATYKVISEKTSKETSKETCNETSEETSKKAFEETAEVIAEETLEETIEKTSKKTAEERSEERSEKTCKEISEETSKEAFEKTSKETSEETAEETAEEASEETCKGTFEKTPEETFEEAPEQACEKTFEETAEEKSEETFEEAFEDASSGTFEETPEETFEEAPEQAFEKTFEETAEEKSEETFEEAFEDASSGTFEETPEETFEEALEQAFEETFEETAEEKSEEAPEVTSEETIKDASSGTFEETPEETFEETHEETSKEKEELRRHMFAKSLAELELSDESKIGYTYKCLGAGFWAFRQKDFRRALTQVVMEAGDADTNGAVAGALLGCKLGVEKLPASWLDGLKHKQWLDHQIHWYFSMLGLLPEPFQLESSLPKDVLLSRMRAVIYGNCIGDAIGLLTEFMTKEEAKEIYGSAKKIKQTTSKEAIEYPQLEYSMKYNDGHRRRWEVGDWTDDSDQMILILRTLLDNNGKADILDFVKRFKVWTKTGFKELGDYGGMGIGHTTHLVISQKDFSKDPHKCAQQVWFDSGKRAAPNGGVMRTSVLGIQDFSDIPTVIENTRQICKVTHADPRCIASCVAVTTAIALMLQGKYCKKDGTEYDVKKLCKKAYKYACKELQTSKEKEELHRHMFAESLAELELSDESKIGYTYKCLGAGFWAFRQEDFRRALTQVVMEAGDADTNGAVAGALLGCKLGVEKLPASWLDGLKHKQWLDKQIVRYFSMLGFIP